MGTPDQFCEWLEKLAHHLRTDLENAAKHVESLAEFIKSEIAGKRLPPSQNPPMAKDGFANG